MTSKRRISVAGIQYLHQEGAREANLAQASNFIRKHPGHDVYVLPELASSGYGLKAFRELNRLAEELDGPSFQAFSRLAQEMNSYICYSYPRKGKQGRQFISTAVVNRQGERIASYDKWHVCQNGDAYEKDYFDSGHLPNPAFSIDGIQTGLCICYDIRFPELVRKLAIEENAVLLLHPGGWPRDAGFQSWHPFVYTRAIENSMYIMSVNRAGSENGHSVFCPPYPDFIDRHPTYLPDREAEGVLVGIVDLDALTHLRQTYPLLTDRRPDMYSA